MQMRRRRLPVVLTLLALLLAVAGGMSDAFAAGFKPGIVSTLSTDIPDEPTGDPDQPQTNKRLKPISESDETAGSGLWQFRGVGRVWTTWFVYRWLAR